jgi:hypothetical protein
MTLHNEDGISPDAGVRGPLHRREEHGELAPDQDVDTDPDIPQADDVDTDDLGTDASGHAGTFEQTTTD